MPTFTPALLSNITWAGNTITPSGAHFTFSNDGELWSNGTGSCTVSSSIPIPFLAGFSMYVDPYQGDQTWTFYDLREDPMSQLSFYMAFEMEGEDPGNDFLDVQCQNDLSLPDGYLAMATFPMHQDDTSSSGAIAAKGGLWPESFFLTFEDGGVPDDISFFDVRVTAELQGNTATIDTLDVASQDLWFSMNYTTEGNVNKPSYTIVANIPTE